MVAGVGALAVLAALAHDGKCVLVEFVLAAGVGEVVELGGAGIVDEVFSFAEQDGIGRMGTDDGP